MRNSMLGLERATVDIPDPAPDATAWEGLHSPRFHLDEDCLPVGVELMVRTAFRLLTEGLPASGDTR